MSSNSPTILHGDPEHDSLRMVIPLILLVGLGLGYWLFLAILPRVFGGDSSQFMILSACGAIPFGLLIMKGGDLLLKRVWHSGRDIILDDGVIRFKEPDAAEQQFSLQEDLQILRWQFKLGPYSRIGRERQIQNGWHCFAVQLQDNGGRLVAHTFLSPHQAAEQLATAAFTTLNMEEIYDMSVTNRMQKFWSPSGRPDLPSSLVIGDHGRYWVAERNRWDEGVELTPADFATLIKALPKKSSIRISNE